jgi:hypothetical protein
MIYNTHLKKQWRNSHCLDCPHFISMSEDLPKQCTGIGKRCVSIDTTTAQRDLITGEISQEWINKMIGGKK